jgi:hypothetical protein
VWGASKGIKRVEEITRSLTWDDDLPGKMRTLSYVRTKELSEYGY